MDNFSNLTTQNKAQFKVEILTGLFIAGLICSNLFGSKIAVLLGIDFSVGLIAFPITFLITDIIGEVYGKKKAQQVVYIGLVAMIFTLILTTLSVLMPTAERSYIKHGEFAKVIGQSIRMQIASITAFILSQSHDVWAFHFWKSKTKGRFLWIRNNLSTIVSQFIDSVVFMFIAFWHLPDFVLNTFPGITDMGEKFTVGYIFELLIPWWILKALIAVFDTPFIYLGVKWLKKDAPETSGAFAKPNDQ